jgi:hypothetical protein
MIDSNTAIMVTFTLAQGWQKCAIPANDLGKTPRCNEAARYRTRGFLEGFWETNKQSSSMMRFHQGELMILIRRSKGKEFRQKRNLVQNLAHKRNLIKEQS